jgi:hypothetical protein
MVTKVTMPLRHPANPLGGIGKIEIVGEITPSTEHAVNIPR